MKWLVLVTFIDFYYQVFRHGERNLMTPYPTSLYKNESYWPGGRSALTKVIFQLGSWEYLHTDNNCSSCCVLKKRFNWKLKNGKKAHYELGEYLRLRYQNLIGTGYSPYKVYIRSTDQDRNLMSAECTAAGLFPPSREEVWNEELNWQPIPIHTRSLEEDYLLYSFVACPRFDQLFQQRLASPEVEALMEKHRPLIEFMERNSGMTLRKVNDVWALYSGLVIENRRGL